MNAKQIRALGIPHAALTAARRAAAEAAAAGMKKPAVREALRRVLEHPEDYREDPVFGATARMTIEALAVQEAEAPEADASASAGNERRQPAFYRRWGEHLDANSVEQMENACRLPVAVRGALMPDAHLGYGLPIGGVLATRDAVIPYAVGVDIACRMKMSVFDLPVRALREGADRLARAIEAETRFGVGASWRPARSHDVMDADWAVSPITYRLKDKAWEQLGTSGSGNHFAEFGVLTVLDDSVGLAKGAYVALLTHSGSRGTGNEVARYYSNLAMNLRRDLPGGLRHLAWLDLASHEGREYWEAMQLMGRYAAANHAIVHRAVARHLGAETILDIENHHNFAWREAHSPDAEGRLPREEVIVHRKGATPASRGVVGIIPGSMAAPGFVVRGLGNPASLESASHGAGRRMSRKEAQRRYRWSEVEPYLRSRGVRLLSAGLDEVPMAYKDIEEVMAAQTDLVAVLARFDPQLVKMAPAGERPED